MKKRLWIIVLSCLLFLCSCQDSSYILCYNSTDYVELWNYDSLCVDSTYTTITDNDVASIIETELSVNENYVPITDRKEVEEGDILLVDINGDREYYFVGCEIYSNAFDQEILQMQVGETRRIEIVDKEKVNVTVVGVYRTATISDVDFILECYGYTNWEELQAFIKSRATEEILFNYAYDMVCEKSIIKGVPQEIEKQIEKDTEESERQIKEYYGDMDTYFSENGMTEDMLVESIAAGYRELMLCKAILDREKIIITEEEIRKHEKNEDISNCYDAYKEVAYSRVREVLLSKVYVTNSTNE